MGDIVKSRQGNPAGIEIKPTDRSVHNLPGYFYGLAVRQTQRQLHGDRNRPTRSKNGNVLAGAVTGGQRLDAFRNAVNKIPPADIARIIMISGNPAHCYPLK